MHQVGTAVRPLRVAIVGAGPSGFYALKALRKRSDVVSEVDLFDRLPTPYGLVRGGVAPDHPAIKRVVKQYSRLAEQEGVRFFGGVKLGVDVAVEELTARYDAVVYAMGCEAGRDLGVPGEDLEGVHTATEFVFWYNGHPEYRDRSFNLGDARRIMVVGNGNVAVDVARMLARDAEELATTDVAEHALQVFRGGGHTDVVMLGRRGAAQSAFSPKELEEMCKLTSLDVVVPAAAVAPDAATTAWLESGFADKSAARNLEILTEQARTAQTGAPRRIHTWFTVSPIEFVGEGGKLTHVRLQRNALTWDGKRVRPTATDETWLEPAQLCFKAIGYRGVEVPGVPHEAWGGTIPNEDGRVEGRRGEYVVGWAKRGPSGLIGHNGPDSAATVEVLLADLAGAAATELEGDIATVLRDRGVRWASFEDWKQIDAEEIRRGQVVGKPREKFTEVAAMMAVLDGSQTA